MASLANQTISSTYDGLIKTSTDQPVGVSGVQLLEDGVGNTLALSVGRANQGVTVTGTLTATALSGPLTGNVDGNVTGDLTGTVTGTSVLADGVIATTQATSDNSTKVATTAFVKSVVTAEDLDIAGDTGTGAVDLDSQSLTIEGTANEIETSASGQTITIGLPSSVTVGTLTATNLGGTLSTAAQPNVTSVGTLSSLAVSGTVSTGVLTSSSSSGGTSAIFSNLGGGNANGIELRGGTIGTSVNWRIEKDSTAGNALQITPSTANGGTTYTTPIVSILSSGNVGIGISSPFATLQIGDGNSSAFQVIDSSAGGSILFNKASTNSAFVGEVEQGLGSGDGLLLYTYSGATRPIRFYTEAVERMQVISTGLSFPNGNGIDFSASAGGGATSSLLDDYEEGTWTMGVAFGGASAGVTYSNNTGTYTKIGRQVTVNGYLALSSKGSSTGTAVITGLPFTIPNVLANYAAVSVYLYEVTFANQYQSGGNINTTTVGLTEITEAGAVSSLNDANFANNSEIIINFTYFV
jgi:hypothetical protein